SLADLDVPCPRPAGGFYLYPDFSPWCSSLATMGIRTGIEFAHYLLEEWDIATLPGSAFGEPPESLRLRLSTSLLCLPGYAASPFERDAALWEMLSKAKELLLGSNVTLSMPALERAQSRLTEVIHFLNSRNPHHKM
ncbi:MAG TPA: aminotransferase class I/II-fold pyridoxal phosphate-dependent enzyme, partial [Ktedonobacteraceae bacterium]